MDYELFFVRPVGKPQKNSTRLFRVSDAGISFTALSGAEKVDIPFVKVTSIAASSEEKGEFSFDVDKGGGVLTTHRFTCDARSALLTAMYNKLDDLNGIGTDFNTKKHSSQRGDFLDTVLRVRCTSIVKMVNAGVKQERLKVNALKKINLMDIEKVQMLYDDARVVLLHLKSRTVHLLLRDAAPFVAAIQRNMKSYLDHSLVLEKITAAAMEENVAALHRSLRQRPVLYEFAVTKHKDSHTKVERARTLFLTSEHIIEQHGGEVVGAHSLQDILGVVVVPSNDREVVIEFKRWRPTQYFVAQRDAFIASMSDVMSLMRTSRFTFRLEPLFPCTLPDRPLPQSLLEYENYLVAQLLAAHVGGRYPNHWLPLLREYVANIQVGDLQNGEPRLLSVLMDFLKDTLTNTRLGPSDSVLVCTVLQRILSTKRCFESIKDVPDLVPNLYQCMRSPNAMVSYAASLVLKAAVKFIPSEGVADVTMAAKDTVNKLLVLSPENLFQLVALLHTHAFLGQNAVQVLGVLELLVLALNSPLSQENDLERNWFKALETALMSAADVLCTVCRSHSTVVFRCNAILLRSLLIKASPAATTHIQKVALSRCAVLLYLKVALFHRNDMLRLLSSNMVYLLMEGNKDIKRLIEAVLPKGVMYIHGGRFLAKKATDRDTRAVQLTAWLETLDLLRTETLNLPTVVWNDLKRRELQRFLMEQVEAFDTAAASKHDVVHNIAEVQLIYSPASENHGSVINGVHVELLTDSPESDSPFYGYPWQLREPVEFFESLFQFTVLAFSPLRGGSSIPEIDVRLGAHALNWVYKRYSHDLKDSLQRLNVIPVVVLMLREAAKSEQPVLRQKLLQFLTSVMEGGGKPAILQFIRASGVAVLIPMMVTELAVMCKDPLAYETDAAALSSQQVSRQNSTAASPRAPVSPHAPSENFGELSRQSSSNRLLPPSPKSTPPEENGVVEGGRKKCSWEEEALPEGAGLAACLDLVETMLRLSCGAGSLDKFPPPLAILALVQDDMVAHLVQLLLRAREVAFRRVLNVLASVVRAHRLIGFRLYKFGFFDFLLWKVVVSESSPTDKRLAADFLAFVHLCQRPEAMAHAPLQGVKGPDQLPWHASILRLYVPESLLVKLIAEGPEVFIGALGSEHNSPEIVWNASMLAHLQEHLETRLGPYVKARAEDPLTIYHYEAPTPLVYPELAGAVYCTPLYLHNLLDTERHALYDIADPTSFHTSLVQELRSVSNLGTAEAQPSPAEWRAIASRSLLLLKAQELVLQRYPQVSLPSDTEAIIIGLAKPALRICNTDKSGTEPDVSDLLNISLRVLRRICAANDLDVAGVSSTALNFALSVLSTGPSISESHTAEPSSINAKLEAAVTGALGIAELAATSREGRRLLNEDSRWKKGFWWTLTCASRAVFDSDGEEMSPYASTALDCLNHFAGDELFCDLVITQGLYLPLLLMLVPPAKAPPVEDSSAQGVLMNFSVCVLRTLHHTLALLGGRAPTERQLDVRTALTKVLPEPLLGVLEDPEEGPTKFIQAAWSHVERPGMVWTEEVRAELRRKVGERLKLHSTAIIGGVPCVEEDEVSWLSNFQYECLADYIVINGVYIRGYANGQWQGFELTDGPAFCVAVHDWLEKHCSAVLEPQEGKPEAAALDNFLVVLAALRECVKHGVQNAAVTLLENVRYPFLQRLLEADHVPAVQCVASGIARALFQHATSRDAVLASPVFGVLARHLWQAVAGLSTAVSPLFNDTMRAFLALSKSFDLFSSPSLLLHSQSLPSTDEITASFTQHALLLPILSLFFNTPLTPLASSPAKYPVDAALPPSEPGSVSELAPPRVMAARVLGSLVLACNRVVYQKKQVERTGSMGRNTLVSVRDENVDVHELSHVLDPGSSGRTPGPAGKTPDLSVLRTLLLLLPVEILSTLAQDPEAGITLYESDVCSPRLVWGPWARARSEQYLSLEAGGVADRTKDQLCEWSSELERPLFLRYSTVIYSGATTPFLEKEAEGYARELYMAGFYLDQFLHDPEYAFPPLLLDRFLRELRRYIMLAGSADGPRKDAFDFDDRRRLLLAYLLLSKTWPELVTPAAKVDIFYPIYEIINCGSGEDHRGLSQLAMLIFHCSATTEDVAEYMSTEELVYTLNSYLELAVPTTFAGRAGTDPRLCCLVFLLRLVRLSSKAVDLAVHLGVTARLADLMVDSSASDEVMLRTTEVLACMCADKRKGAQVAALLENIVPLKADAYGVWRRIPPTLDDEFDDAHVLPYFMENRISCPWWTVDTPGGVDESDDDPLAAAPVTVVDASVAFPKAKLLEFVGVAEAAFRRTVAVAARVSPRCVTIVRKRAGSVIVDFMVTFQKRAFDPHATEAASEPEEEARAFKELLESDTAAVFATKYFEPFGIPRTSPVAIRQASLGDSRRASFGRPRQLSFSNLSANDLPSPEPSPSPALHRPPSFSRAASGGALLASPNSPLTYQPSQGTGQASTLGGPAPTESSSRLSTSSSTASLSSLPLDEALERVLDGADISTANKAAAKTNFLEAFEDDVEELARMVGRYPKLIQKYTLQPQLCYDLMLVWEEHCLDALTPEETALHGRLISEVDMCRLDDPEAAVEAAKAKFQQILSIRKEQEEESKKEGAGTESKQADEGEEIKQMTKGKIQKKAKSGDPLKATAEDAPAEPNL